MWHTWSRVRNFAEESSYKSFFSLLYRFFFKLHIVCRSPLQKRRNNNSRQARCSSREAHRWALVQLPNCNSVYAIFLRSFRPISFSAVRQALQQAVVCFGDRANRPFPTSGRANCSFIIKLWCVDAYIPAGSAPLLKLKSKTLTLILYSVLAFKWMLTLG